jgi:hypothetical protein
MAQIGIDQIGTTCQLITPSQQTLTDLLDLGH